MKRKETVLVAKDDVVTVWTILENLAVSFDQMGASFAEARETGNSRKQQGLQEALVAYLTPDLVQAINDARMRLGQYIPDTEAETLSEQIAYWDYAAPSQETHPTA